MEAVRLSKHWAGPSIVHRKSVKSLEVGNGANSRNLV